MKNLTILCLLILAFAASAAYSQDPNLVRRTVTKTDRFDFGAGGTVAITGAPVGSIRIVSSGGKNEIEITAEIELAAPNAADLALLEGLTGFVTDESPVKTGIVTVGGHNKFGQKKLPKDLPKHLAGLPFAVNYTISVPRYTDLEIDGGKGAFSLSGVEGSLKLNLLESDAVVEINGGNAMITIGTGTLDLSVGPRGWRGRIAEAQVGDGEMTVRLPSNLSAEVDASMIRSGSIENNVPDLKPRDRKVPFSERSVIARAGVGGAPLKFMVGAGKLRLERLTRVTQ